MFFRFHSLTRAKYKFDMLGKKALEKKISKVSPRSKSNNGWIPKKNYRINPLNPNKKIIKELINEYLLDNSDEMLIEIENFQSEYNAYTKQLYLTIVGKFERYDFNTKDFELSLQVRKFLITLE